MNIKKLYDLTIIIMLAANTIVASICNVVDNGIGARSFLFMSMTCNIFMLMQYILGELD